MKVVRILLSIILLLLIVVVLALGALYYFIDPNKLKPVIVAEVKRQTGYIVSIDDELAWTLYPRIAICVPRMKLTASGEANPFADLQDVRVAVDVAQLVHGHGKLQGDVRIANLRLVDLRLSKVETVLHWQDNVLSLNPIRAVLYQGALTGVATVRFPASQPDVPHWGWNVTFSHIQLKPLLADISPGSKLVVSGTGEIEMQASTQGKSRSQMIVSTNGKTTFSLTDGAVEGIDLNYLVRSADALLNKQPLPEPQNLFETNFNNLRGSVIIANGVATITAVQLTSPAFVTKGQGEIDLMSSALDIKLNTTPQTQIKTQWDVPIIVTGTLMYPRVKLDSDQISRYALKQQLEKVKDKAREAIQKHIPGVAGEYLQKLLN